MSIKFNLLDFRDEPEWIQFKNDYVTKIRTASEIESAEFFMSGVIQGICSVTPECERMNYVEECSITLEGFRLTIPVPENSECWLDDLEVEVELVEEE